MLVLRILSAGLDIQGQMSPTDQSRGNGSCSLSAPDLLNNAHFNVVLVAPDTGGHFITFFIDKAGRPSQVTRIIDTELSNSQI